MKLVTWNVNGIRAAIKKGLYDYIAAESPDVLCLQETKIDAEKIEKEIEVPKGYHAFWNSAERKGYSGTATFCKTKPVEVRNGIGVKRFDTEGRVLATEFKDFVLFNVYFPNGTSGYHRVEYKLDFYDALLDHCLELRESGKKLIVCGDYNTAHKEIDLARPRENSKTSGFLPEERVKVDEWLEAGFVDVFRDFHPEPNQYSWWSFRSNARANNVGWRIDYHLVTDDLKSRCKDAYLQMDVEGSDHCPVVLNVK